VVLNGLFYFSTKNVVLNGLFYFSMGKFRENAALNGNKSLYEPWFGGITWI